MYNVQNAETRDLQYSMYGMYGMMSYFCELVHKLVRTGFYGSMYELINIYLFCVRRLFFA